MLFKVVVFSGLLVLVLSASDPQKTPIISEKNEVNPDGSFEWSYQSGDGTQQQAVGENRQIGHDKGEVIQGSVSWTDPEGGQHYLSYVADENGYQPESADLPVGPEIPVQIARALAWIATQPIPPNEQ